MNEQPRHVSIEQSESESLHCLIMSSIGCHPKSGLNSIGATAQPPAADWRHRLAPIGATAGAAWRRLWRLPLITSGNRHKR